MATRSLVLLFILGGAILVGCSPGAGASTELSKGAFKAHQKRKDEKEARTGYTAGNPAPPAPTAP